MSEWESLETAPRGGIDILIGRYEGSEWVCVVVKADGLQSWHEDCQIPTHWTYIPSPPKIYAWRPIDTYDHRDYKILLANREQKIVAEGFFESSFGVWSTDFEPTHWMPLPEAPISD